MLEEMRKHSKSFIIYVLFGILIVVFAINFGPGSRGCQFNISEFATVNGETISENDFSRLYSRYYNYLSSIYPNFNREQAEKLNLKQTVLDEMINKVLLAQEASKRGLVVTDEELRYAILNDPQFLNDGKFDKEAYEVFVTRYNGVSLNRYETEKRRDILAAKMESLFSDSVTVSEQEILAEYKMQRDRLSARYVNFKASSYIGSEVIEDSEAQKLLDNGEEAVKEYYQKEIFRYRGRRRISASRILLAADAEAQAAEIRGKLAGGADFASLAKEFSKGPEAANGGSMGVISEEPENFPLLRAVATASVGQVVADNVVTEAGINIIKVDNIENPATKTFDELKLTVAKDMVAEQKARAQAKSAAEAWLAKAAAIDGSSLNAILAASEAEATKDMPFAEDVPWINRDTKAVPGIGLNEELVSDLFKAETNKVLNKVYTAGNNSVVAWVVAREEANMGEFEENRELLKSSLRELKRRQLFAGFIKEIRDNARIHINMNAGNTYQDYSNF